jgi:hypothetical protein
MAGDRSPFEPLAELRVVLDGIPDATEMLLSSLELSNSWAV